MQISSNFAPPFKLIAPFFILAVLVLLICAVSLFSFNVDYLSSLNAGVFAWVHMFLLGFVMMIIFGAMAQLVPVVLEVEHFAVELYYAIYPLLLIGTILMVFGFVKYPILLPFGGVVALIAFGIFLIETFMTLLKIKKIDFVTVSVIIANIFLLIGIIVGIILSLGYSGILQVEIHRFLTTHIYFVFIGYVGITIIGISLVLLPMFWLSHSFFDKWVKVSLLLLSLGVCFVGLGALFSSELIQFSGYLLSLIAMILYFIQIISIYLKRARVEKNIYLKSIFVSIGFFLISIVLAVVFIVNSNQNILLTLGWFSFGFVLFLISGHLYKIIPFLVWYERFSPFVGKRKVPMFSDMVPKRSSNMQYLFSSVGWFGIGVALLFQWQILFLSSVSFLFIGIVFLFKDIVYMINFKEN